MIKVTNEVNTYDESEAPSIKVHNHWSRSNMVELEIEGKRYKVVVRELKAAIDNATNTCPNGIK